ncbi:MAG TPA: DegV family protein [Pseudonocardiaceae bacterium]|jgi:DegV family protein with EDD domain|nr:DegV family protein [Pseudonocardiaceae bacterium]
MSDPSASPSQGFFRSGTVAVVTDSTACVPPELAESMGIRVVQQQLHIGDQDDAGYEDEARVPRERILGALRRKESVTTSAPDSGAFFWTYADAAAAGASAVVSLHISSRMSDTCAAAREAAAQAPIPVQVLDSGTLGMSLGFAVLSAARVAASGAELGQVLAIAGVRIARSTELLHVESLDYLRRGGRIGAAAHLIGSAFAVKPMLTVRHGQVAPLERTVGTDRALRRLVDKAARLAEGQAVDLAVEHTGADERAERVLDALRRRVSDVGQLVSVSVTSIITAHVGPGAMGITISPAV